MELLQGDVRRLQESEAAGQLSSTQQAHIGHLLRALQAAKEVIKANVMKTGDGAGGWMEQKAWIFMQTMRKDKVKEDIHAARDDVVRSAQLLNLALSAHLVQSLRCSQAADGGQSEAEDAQQLLDYMQQHQHQSDAQVEAILAQLQQGRADQAQQAERMAAELAKVCLVNDGLKHANEGLALQLERIVLQLTRLPAMVQSGAQSLTTSMPEFIEGQSLRLKADEVLGEGSSGAVMKAECVRVVGSGVWVECAFKLFTVKLHAGGGAHAKEKREKLHARYVKAVRKEAAVMWLLHNQPNIVRLYGVCSRPLGLVFEYCNRGTLQQWLWAQVRGKDALGRKVSRFVSTQQLAEASSPAGSGDTTQQPQHSDDEDGEDYAQLLSDGVIQGQLTLAQRLLIAQELISAVAFLHSRHLAHGDIKSSNVLVHDMSAGMGVQESSSTPPAAAAQPLLCVRLSDFGSAKVQASFTKQLGSTLQVQSAAGGTPRWSAPEQLMADADAGHATAAASTASTFASTASALSSSSSSYSSSSSSSNPPAQADAHGAPHFTFSPPTTKPPSSLEDRSADVYSLSLLLAELFTSLPPYAHLHDAKVHHAIYSHQPPYEDALLDGVSPALRLLVRACTLPLRQRATLAVLQYQLWPQMLAALSGWKGETGASAASPPASPPPLPARPAAASASLSPLSGGSSPKEADAPTKAPPIPARPAAARAAPARTHLLASADSGPRSLQLGYERDGDVHGLFHYLGTRGGAQPWENPCTDGLVTVSSSSLSEQSRSCTALVHIERRLCCTRDEPHSWFCIDLHRACFRPSHYTLQATARCAPRHWKLEGSSDGEQWDVLDEHSDDNTLDVHSGNNTLPHSTCTTHTWSVQPTTSAQGRWHRYFRIQQTGVNSDGNHRFRLFPMELYGELLVDPNASPWPSKPAAPAGPSAPATPTSPTAAPVFAALQSLMAAGAPPVEPCPFSAYTDMPAPEAGDAELNGLVKPHVLLSAAGRVTFAVAEQWVEPGDRSVPLQYQRQYQRLVRRADIDEAVLRGLERVSRQGDHRRPYIEQVRLMLASLPRPPPSPSSASAAVTGAAVMLAPVVAADYDVLPRQLVDPFLVEQHRSCKAFYELRFNRPSSTYRQGLTYLLAPAPMQSDVKAMERFQQAAAVCEPHALYQLGQCYLHGQRGLKRDVLRGFDYLLRAAALGHPDAHQLLAALYDCNTTMRVRAQLNSRLNALGGRHVLARAVVALVSGVLVQSDSAALRGMLERTPELSDSVGCLLALLLASPSAPADELQQAYALYLNAAKRGNAFAALTLADRLLADKQHAAALFVYTMAAEQGSAEAQAEVALSYWDGEHCAADHGKAEEYTRLYLAGVPRTSHQRRYTSALRCLAQHWTKAGRFDDAVSLYVLIVDAFVRSGVHPFPNDLAELAEILHKGRSRTLGRDDRTALRLCDLAVRQRDDLRTSTAALACYCKARILRRTAHSPQQQAEVKRWVALAVQKFAMRVKEAEAAQAKDGDPAASFFLGHIVRSPLLSSAELQALHVSADDREHFQRASEAVAKGYWSKEVVSRAKEELRTPARAAPFPPQRSAARPKPSDAVAKVASVSSQAAPLLPPPLPAPSQESTLSNTAGEAIVSAERARATLQLRYQHDGDECGLFYHLGTRGGCQSWQNPCTAGLVSVSCSSSFQGSKPCSALVDRKGGVSYTKDEPNAWFCFDLHSACFALSHYTLMTRWVRNWKLEASVDGVQWRTLSTHTNDNSLEQSGVHTWSLPPSLHPQTRWCRYFRILQTGVNGWGHHTLDLEGVELYGQLLVFPQPSSS